jgi:O-antigen ligase
MAILYSGSRSTWLALFLSTLAVLWIYRQRRHAMSTTLMASCAVLAVGAVTVAGAQVIPSRVEALVDDWQRMNEQGNYDTSLGNRVALWQIGLSAIEESPIIGHGPQSTRGLIRDGLAKIGIDKSYSHLHNGFLNAWVETGIVGMLSLLALFVAAGYIAVKTLATTAVSYARVGAIMLIGLVTTYVVDGVFGILVGHDILDTVLLAFLAVGIYLAGGTSMLRQGVTETQSSPEASDAAL